MTRSMGIDEVEGVVCVSASSSVGQLKHKSTAGQQPTASHAEQTHKAVPRASASASVKAPLPMGGNEDDDDGGGGGGGGDEEEEAEGTARDTAAAGAFVAACAAAALRLSISSRPRAVGRWARSVVSMAATSPASASL